MIEAAQNTWNFELNTFTRGVHARLVLALTTDPNSPAEVYAALKASVQHSLRLPTLHEEQLYAALLELGLKIQLADFEQQAAEVSVLARELSTLSDFEIMTRVMEHHGWIGAHVETAPLSGVFNQNHAA